MAQQAKPKTDNRWVSMTIKECNEVEKLFKENPQSQKIIWRRPNLEPVELWREDFFKNGD